MKQHSPVGKASSPIGRHLTSGVGPPVGAGGIVYVANNTDYNPIAQGGIAAGEGRVINYQQRQYLYCIGDYIY